MSQTQEMVSERQDGRGHWPKDKRRSRVAAHEVAALVRVLERRVERTSARFVARQLQISDRTVRRWLKGEDWPLPASIARLKRL